MQTLLGPAYKWLVDTLKKVTVVQQQVNSAIQVVGMTVTNNSPTGGKIAWSACTVYLNGTAYPIAAGNSGTDPFVWWVSGASTFSHGTSYTPGPTIYPILTNVAGTADLTWNKVGASSIQAAQLVGGGVLIGLEPQVASITISGSGNSTILTYTGAGALQTIFYQTSGGYQTGGGTTLAVTIDGQTQTYTLTDAGAPDTYDKQPFAHAVNGDGTANAAMTLGLYLTFTSSVQVSVNNTSGGGWVAGTLIIRIGWGKKL